jgi:hypothetical protein
MFDSWIVADIGCSFSCAGVRVQSLHKGQVHMDMDFKWGGDGDIVLDVAVMGTKLPIQVLRNSIHSLPVCWI